MKKCAASVCLLLIPAAGLSAADNVLTSQEKAAGWTLLFDGKTLHGWDSSVPAPAGRGRGNGPPQQPKAPASSGGSPAQGSSPRACSTHTEVAPGASHWEIVAGALSPCGEPSGYLTSKESYKDFILALDFRAGEDTNSGVFIRSPGGNAGYEVQIWKDQPAGYNTGSIVGAGKTEKEFKFNPDQWNHYEITADSDHLVVVLNETKTLEIRDSQFAEGRIRLQYQKFPIEFKNIKLKVIRQ